MSLSRCFLDFAVNGEKLGRVVVRLFESDVPRTSENFKALCIGEHSAVSGHKLSLKNCNVCKIIPNCMIEIGEFQNEDGTGEKSIEGRPIDEVGSIPFDQAGLLGMVGAGRHTNGSQFFITTSPCPHLNSEHTAFGKVSSGMKFLRQLQRVEVGENGCPLQQVAITASGLMRKRVRRDSVPPADAVKTKKGGNHGAPAGSDPVDREARQEQDKETATAGEEEPPHEADNKPKRREAKAAVGERRMYGKSGRILKGRGFSDMRFIGNFGGIGFHSETPSAERDKRARREERQLKRRRKDGTASREVRHERKRARGRYSPSSPSRRDGAPRYKRDYGTERAAESEGKSGHSPREAKTADGGYSQAKRPEVEVEDTDGEARVPAPSTSEMDKAGSDACVVEGDECEEDNVLNGPGEEGVGGEGEEKEEGRPDEQQVEIK